MCMVGSQTHMKTLFGAVSNKLFAHNSIRQCKATCLHILPKPSSEVGRKAWWREFGSRNCVMGAACSAPNEDGAQRYAQAQLVSAIKKGDQAKYVKVARLNLPAALELAGWQKAQAIHAAAKKGHTQVLSFLVSLGAAEEVVLERNSALSHGRASRSASQSSAAVITGRGLHRASGAPVPIGRPSPVPGLAPGVTADAPLAPTAPSARPSLPSYSAAPPAGDLDGARLQQRASGVGAGGAGGGGAGAGGGGAGGGGGGGGRTGVDLTGAAAATARTSATGLATTQAGQQSSAVVTATSTAATTTSQTGPSTAVPAMASSTNLSPSAAAPTAATATAPPPAPSAPPPPAPPPPVVSEHLSSWINAPDRRGRTPLATAVLHNRIEFVSRLISLGADPWARAPARPGCGGGMSGGGGAGSSGAAGAGISRFGGGAAVGGRGGGVTPLHLAAWLGHAPLAAEILKSGVPGPNPRRRLADVQVCVYMRVRVCVCVCHMKG